MDYKDTINLPQTAFAMKANLANREPGMIEAWERAGLYRKLLEQTAERPLWILHDGPPYANGDIHMGHAVNKILKDMVVKSRLLAGYHSPYVPGWDCHGLPIELQVEKKAGKVGHKVDAGTFRRLCREYADRQIDLQRNGFRRMGVLGDWDNPYLTKAFLYEADMIRALARIVESGHLLQGAKPVNWCFDCGSALAEAEIEYIDKTSPSIDVLFAAVDSAALFRAFSSSPVAGTVGIPIWTTTPWTLPANEAVTLHADLEYVLVGGQLDGQATALVVARDLLAEVTKRLGMQDVTALGSAPGAALEHLRLQHPFYDRDVPVILGDHVTVEAGTGAVHTAPGHGEEDFQVGQLYDLPVTNPVGADGRSLRAQLSPLLAPQVAHGFSRDPAVAHLYGAGRFARAGPAGHQVGALGSWVGRGAHRWHGGESPRLVYFQAADLGCADHTVHRPPGSCAAPGHAGIDGPRRGPGSNRRGGLLVCR
jgi:isoleucyl-tRNA synthetase